MTQSSDKHAEEKRHRGARLTAWAIGLVAVGIYAAFLLSVMLP